MLYLYRIQIIIFLSILLASNSYGQSYDFTSNNYYKFAKKTFYFGMALGLNSNKYKILNNDSFILSDSFNVVESNSSTGFNVGIISNFKLGEDVDFRFVPTFNFSDRNLIYTDQIGTESTTFLETIYTELPLVVRYKSKPYHDKRVFVSAGFKYGFDLSNRARTRNEEAVIKLSESDFSVQYGAGIQFFFKYFIFSPEIQISHSLTNNLIFDDEVERSAVIDELQLRSIFFTINFEG